MPVSFSRLRIAGFKSFAEPQTVEILAGLTGIVGPNGCGKSNVVEALRWAMGESSARTLRGGEMDDVIFAGTANRPSRNIAEVTLRLEETHGLAPPPFHDNPELEIVRRIERGSGSVFHINGREARARDVQTLFADLASGARASAMVSQGRVSAIVNARPDERRTVLEEAAGITGLHARRHEAELKLRAAEANLARAEDLRGQLEVQLDGLKRQARQANRFRTISATIRQSEAELLALQRARVETLRAEARQAVHDANQAVAAATATATAASAEATDAAAALPPLRGSEGEARTALERHRIAGEQIAAEERRARETLAASAQRLQHISRDLAHAEQQQRDATAAVARLADEERRLAAEQTAHPVRLERADAAVRLAEDASGSAEAAADTATERAADLVARHRAMSETLAQADQRARKLRGESGRLGEERGRVAAQLVDPAKLDAATAERDAAERAVGEARAATEGAERARTRAQTVLAAVRGRATSVEAARAKLAAEANAVAEVLGVKDGERWPRMVDQLSVPPGLEAALGAALGEELESGCDVSTARHWRELPPLDPPVSLPGGGVALSALVAGPPALARALSAIGLVADEDQAAAAAPELRAGQTLVSRAGALWRWDGYAIRAGTPTAATVRLQQRNRLAELRSQLAEATTAAEAARAERTEGEASERAATSADQQARIAQRAAEQRLERARASAASLAAQATTATARMAGLTEQATRLDAELAQSEAAFADAREQLAALADPSEGRAAMERARVALASARSAETASRAARDTLARQAAGRAHRQRAIEAERKDWGTRDADACGRLRDLSARFSVAQTEYDALAATPDTLAARRAQAVSALDVAETMHRRLTDALAAAEQAAASADRAARAAEAAIAAARERCVRAEGDARAVDHALGVVAERILERLGASPALPDPPADLTAEAEDKARRRLERLAREREEMGPVNLRADIEADEIAKQVAIIEHERGELTTAIGKLRGSIGHLNREGRERLGQVFEDIDRHFRALFARMFGGGRAHLAMVGSDDPLLAGLEIYAQPPGKKLATLSLLSGGEQALTALSLIFAVFRCNPAPICVLDEVDAPLDDANVDRFCTLLDDMVRETQTRFLVVTHHHLTMARMDRLYGVTMQERGVSRLLSVDLRRATEIVDGIGEQMAAE